MVRSILLAVLFAVCGYTSAGQGPGLSMPDTTVAATSFSIRNCNLSRFTIAYPQPVAPNFYAQHLPFFCRQELKMQRRHIPVSFRLGSMELCNRLEQKPAYR